VLKYVEALAGQTVCRIGRSATVDTIEMGDARERDSRGRELPVWQGCRVIGLGAVFDGRYFGPLPATTPVGRAILLWIDQPEKEK
jgi:type IV secretory pathway protease TraF